MAPAAFNAKQEAMIIDFYHKTKCLWDFNAVDYKNKYKKEMALNHLCQSLGVDTHGEPCTVSMIKSKFKNLRTTFQREYRKMQDNKKINDGSTEIYIPKWAHFTKLLFLKDIFPWPHATPKDDIEQSTSSMSMHQEENDQGIIYTSMLAQTMKEEVDDDVEEEEEELPEDDDDGAEAGGGSRVYIQEEPHVAESILPEQHLHEGEDPQVEQPTSTVNYNKQQRPKTAERKDMMAALYWSPPSHPQATPTHHHHHNRHRQQTGNTSQQQKQTTSPMATVASESADQLFGRHVAASLSQIQNKYYKELFKLKVQELILEYTFKE